MRHYGDHVGFAPAVVSGVFDVRLIHSSEIKTQTALLLDAVLVGLEAEVAKSLEYITPPELNKKDLLPIARTYTLQFHVFLTTSIPRIPW